MTEPIAPSFPDVRNVNADPRRSVISTVSLTGEGTKSVDQDRRTRIVYPAKMLLGGATLAGKITDVQVMGAGGAPIDLYYQTPFAMDEAEIQALRGTMADFVGAFAESPLTAATDDRFAKLAAAARTLEFNSVLTTPGGSNSQRLMTLYRALSQGFAKAAQNDQSLPLLVESGVDVKDLALDTKEKQDLIRYIMNQLAFSADAIVNGNPSYPPELARNIFADYLAMGTGLKAFPTRMMVDSYIRQGADLAKPHDSQTPGV